MDDDIVIYTCSVCNYDDLSLIQKPQEGLRFVFFTNDLKAVPPGWEGRKLQSPPRLKNGHDINRYHKIFPHQLFPECRYSVYMDGNVNFSGSFKKLVYELRESEIALAAFKHPESRKLFEEQLACEKYNKFDLHDKTRADYQILSYKSKGLNISQFITANYFLVRDHSHPNFDICMVDSTGQRNILASST